jgi:1-phosphofructokinase
MLRLPGATRTNIKLAVAERGDSTDINLPGLALAPEALQAAEQALGERLDAAVAPGDWCELAGSLPRHRRRPVGTPGPAPGRPRRADRHRHRRRGAGHAAGPAVRPARGPVVPVAFIKPNRAELEELVARPCPTPWRWPMPPRPCAGPMACGRSSSRWAARAR